MPWRETLLLLVRWPFTVTSAVPRPAERTSVGSPVTPVERLSRKRKFGDARGRAFNVCASTACPVLPLEGLLIQGVASPFTVPLSFPPPTPPPAQSTPSLS